MNPLRTQQKVLTWLCVCPSTHNTSQSRKQCYAIFSASVLAAVSCNVISKCGIFSKICVEWFRSSAGCSSSRYFSLKLLERPSIFCCDLPLFYNYTGGFHLSESNCWNSKNRKWISNNQLKRISQYWAKAWINRDPMGLWISAVWFFHVKFYLTRLNG